jgi:hypothetical protein
MAKSKETNPIGDQSYKRAISSRFGEPVIDMGGIQKYATPGGTLSMFLRSTREGQALSAFYRSTIEDLPLTHHISSISSVRAGLSYVVLESEAKESTQSLLLGQDGTVILTVKPKTHKQTLK